MFTKWFGGGNGGNKKVPDDKKGAPKNPISGSKTGRDRAKEWASSTPLGSTQFEKYREQAETQMQKGGASKGGTAPQSSRGITGDRTPSREGRRKGQERRRRPTDGPLGSQQSPRGVGGVG
mmetsp:Transcript_20729/g.60289  ORF Transcript_20729/g.60289 Transcript_20729/m.60289 type:complete len:121 (-) Transcript_20729:2005-2367(-)